MLTAAKVKSELKSLVNPEKAKFLRRYFKTGKGEYAEGDKFIGITVPVQRTVAKKYSDLPLNEIQKLIKDPVHEARVTAVFILCGQYSKAVDKRKKFFVDFLLTNKKFINNWDLVDSCAHQILGDYLINKPHKILFKLAKSENVWDRRIAAVSTYAFIRNRKFDSALKIFEMLLNDKHDLIHKAAGWMLREIGNRNVEVLESFLEKHVPVMPRTMLRYAIEKFPEAKRQKYLQRKTAKS